MALALGIAMAGEAVPPCAAGPAEPGMVAEVVDGDTLVLADGRVVRLAGIEAPKPALAVSGPGGSVLADRARAELSRLTRGKAVALRPAKYDRDRHGRVLAQLFGAEGAWIQAALVAGGFARVRPFADDLTCFDALIRHENAARTAGIGLWRAAEFSVIAADDPSLMARKGLYVVVEGRVVSVGLGNHMDFLNFGYVWRRDFTVMVSAAIAKTLAEDGRAVETLAKRRVRVRGVLEESGGPAIRLRTPGEIEVLDDD